MTQRPPQPPESPRSLDAAERALARALPRLHGRTAPGPDLDARILAAAQEAVRPARSSLRATRPSVRWIAPAALAASLVLAFGMAWQLRPLPSLHDQSVAAGSGASDASEQQAMRAIEPARDMSRTPTAPSKPDAATAAFPQRELDDAQAASAAAIPPPREDLPVVAPSKVQSPSASTASQPLLSAEPSAAQAPSTSATATGSPVEVRRDNRALAEPAVAPTATSSANAIDRNAAVSSAEKTGTTDSAPQASAAKMSSPPATVPQAARNEAWMAADSVFVDDPDDDMPPATAASPAVRDAWLHRIGELLDQGKREAAKDSLAEFRRRYPAAVLPSRLRALEIEP